MNFELLLLIFVFILLGVIFFDYRKKRVLIDEKIEDSNQKTSLEENKTVSNTPKTNKKEKKASNGEFVSKARVINHSLSNNSFADNFEAPKKSKNPEKIICLYVKAKTNESFLGNDLLRVLLSLGCRYGDMKIFHRHEHKNGIGRELFSVASMLEPGSFDLNKLPDAKIPGVVLFFSTAQVFNPLDTYHLMLDAAKKLSQYLGGDLLDGQRQPLAPEKITEMSELLAGYANDAVEGVV